MKWLLCSTYPIVLHSSGIRTVDYIDKGQSLWQIFQGNFIDLLRIANARTVYKDHTSLQENERSSYADVLRGSSSVPAPPVGQERVTNP